MTAATSLIASFTARESSGASGDIWAKLEQAYVVDSSDGANFNDLYQMLARAGSGESAMEYIYDQCPYARIDSDVLTVTLDFYVWVSSHDLHYTLSAGLGTISAGKVVELPRSFDVIFDDATSADLGFLFAGDFVPEMPFFSSTGQIMDDPVITASGSSVNLSVQATGALRATGLATGFKHTLTMQLSEIPVTNTDPYTGEETVLGGYSLENLQTAVTVSWVDGSGQTQSAILEIKVPECVESMVTICSDTTTLYRRKQSSGDPSYLVYYSACNGDILSEGWEEEEDK